VLWFLALAITAEPGYVDPAACRPCHAAIYESYRTTGMGRSFRKAATPQAGAFYHRASNRHYRVYLKNGQWMMRRHQINSEGGETNIVEKPIFHAIGSGNHAITFLSRDASGRLLQLPLSWYSERGGYWEMSPGYDRRDHYDFRREVSESCLFCHNGYPSRANQGMAEGIDCQRCHGPGENHARKPVRANIVNPARLSASLRMDVCLQCHLETASQGITDSLRRPGRTAYSYRPGQPLSGYKVYFNFAPAPERAERVEINHAGYRLLQSKCFAGAGGALQCTTCHDPHRRVDGEQAIFHYRRACQGCHSQDHARQVTDCASCHMPKRRTSDAVHVTMTDHFIQRYRLTERAEPIQPYLGEVVPFRLPGATDDPLLTAAAQIREGNNLEGGIRLLEKLLAGGNSGARAELADAYRQQGDWVRASEMYANAARDKPRDVPILASYGESLFRLGQFDAAEQVLRKLPQKDSRVLNLLGIVLAEKGRLREAEQALRESIRRQEDQPLAQVNLGMVLEKKGDRTGAEQAYLEAIRIQPDLSQARHRLESLRARK
jgi:Tfp pilus assembly protein PilF